LLDGEVLEVLRAHVVDVQVVHSHSISDVCGQNADSLGDLLTFGQFGVTKELCSFVAGGGGGLKV
jgi:enhancing lycopene biosynthesis protein 2